MTATAAAPVLAGPPRVPALDRRTAMRLAEGEYRRVVETLRSLAPGEWAAPTCNPGWDVRALAAHMLGMVAMAASVREQLRQTRAARSRGGEFIDALTAWQVERYDGWPPARLVAEYERLAPQAARARRRMPAVLRRRAMPDQQPVDPPRGYERWTFGYLSDVILTRDPWLHRSDIAAATGREMLLTPEHDGVIVDDVAREWAQRHGRPCTLRLTGPLARDHTFGGAGPGDPTYAVDAVEFCRILSGRGDGEGLLATRVPF